MNKNSQLIDSLWDDFRKAINATYAQSTGWRDDRDCLRDYAEDISWNDALCGLLGRETANERRHRSGRPSVPGFSNQTAAKLILMAQASNGSIQTDMSKGTEFLMYRQTAAEARLIGWLIRESVTKEWRDAVNSIDYTELMKTNEDKT